ncbi:MAG: hypothetical protein R3B47_10905 [Bacteroidia bacterium]
MKLRFRVDSLQAHSPESGLQPEKMVLPLELALKEMPGKIPQLLLQNGVLPWLNEARDKPTP